MSRVLPIVGICLSLVALAFALVPRGEVAPPVTWEPDAPAFADEDVDFLKRRIELLEDDNRLLWDRVVKLERKPAVVTADGAPAPAASLNAEVEKLRAELRSVMAGEVLSDEAGRGAIKEMMREVQADQQRERMVQLEERRVQQQQQQQQRWADFKQSAGLSYAAEQKLTERLATEESERTKKMEQLRLGQATWQEVSDYLRTQRRETDEAVTSLMNDEQKQQYQQVRRNDGGGGGRQRGGGGGSSNAQGGQRGQGSQQGGQGGRQRR